MPFEKGNKLGGRKPIPQSVKDAARAECMHAITRLKEMMDSDDENVAVKACCAILDRGYGKPAQAVEVSGKDGDTIKIESAVKIYLPDNGRGGK